MEKVILQQNKHWQNPYPDLIFREKLKTLIQKLSLKEIQVILGVRRAGKSTLLNAILNELYMPLVEQAAIDEPIAP